MRIVADLPIGHPAEKVWPYLTVPEKWLEFIPSLLERTRVDTGPIEPGAEWRSVDRIGPWKIEFTDKLAEIEPETRVVWIQSEPWNARTEYRLEAVDDHRSVIHVNFEANLSGWMRLMELLPDSTLRRTIRNDYRRLEQLLDEER